MRRMSASTVREIAGIRWDQKCRKNPSLRTAQTTPQWPVDLAHREAQARTENDPQGHSFHVMPKGPRVATILEQDRDGHFVGFI